MPSSHVISGLTQAPRQKGRPRKRKPKDIEGLTANIGKNIFSFLLAKGYHSYQKVYLSILVYNLNIIL